MKSKVVWGWADDEEKWQRLLVATDALAASCPSEKGQDFDLVKVTAAFEAFNQIKDWSGLSGNYIPRRLW